jgi:hypothetical protein
MHLSHKDIEALRRSLKDSRVKSHVEVDMLCDMALALLDTKRQLDMANLALNAAAKSLTIDRVSLDGPSPRINDCPERAGQSIRRDRPKGRPGQ